MADTGNNRIVKWTTNYSTGGVCVVGCTGVAGTGPNQLNGVRDLKFDAQGNLYVTDQSNHRIQKYMIQIPPSPCSTSEIDQFDLDFFPSIFHSRRITKINNNILQFDYLHYSLAYSIPCLR